MPYTYVTARNIRVAALTRTNAALLAMFRCSIVSFCQVQEQRRHRPVTADIQSNSSAGY
jgi:hypothetical protein